MKRITIISGGHPVDGVVCSRYFLPMETWSPGHVQRRVTRAEKGVGGDPVWSPFLRRGWATTPGRPYTDPVDFVTPLGLVQGRLTYDGKMCRGDPVWSPDPGAGTCASNGRPHRVAPTLYHLDFAPALAQHQRSITPQ